MQISNLQFSDILSAHCLRVIDGWDKKTLVSFAYDKMMESFTEYGSLDEILPRLVEDIINHEGGDLDSASEFLVGCGVDGDIADSLINTQE
jgi:hypothetical protein